jgi:hypothetical protein
MITGLLLLLPAALLFASLILGHYPGEDVLRSAHEALRAPRPRPAALVVPHRRAPHRALRPARLVATAIAARPPPSCG